MKLRTAHILATFRAADPAQVTDGLRWYCRANDLAAELDPSDVMRAAAVLAVLSPTTPWPRNAWLAREAYRLHRSGRDVASELPTVGDHARKAAAILSGADPDVIVRGEKVRTFWRAILNPSDPRDVVVDRHAFNIAAGAMVPERDRVNYLGRKGNYERVARLYRSAARTLSDELGEPITPTQVQAVTWAAWRETNRTRNRKDTYR